MPKYEVMFILHAKLEEEQREEAVARFKAYVEDNGGAVSEIDQWGMRRLAYEIEDEREGYYVVMNFEGDNKVLQELERRFKLSENVLRYLISKVEE
ncbi:MAG: 30S ribosomal protein S6 [Firmicutes bacterium]|jgi:small subunit ribosomal protein S6|nr:30S ribosomal protein S6 [Bacillota bacterium]